MGLNDIKAIKLRWRDGIGLRHLPQATLFTTFQHHMAAQVREN